MLARFLAALALIALATSVASAQSGSSKSTSALNAEVGSLVPDNTSGAITPFDVRQVFVDVIASYPNLVSGAPVTYTGGITNNDATCWSTTGVVQDCPKSGNTNTFATANGTLTNGHCVSIDANGNFVDAGGACTTGGGGGTVSSGAKGQAAYYAAAGTTVSGATIALPLTITSSTLQLNLAAPITTTGGNLALNLASPLAVTSNNLALNIATPLTITGGNLTLNRSGNTSTVATTSGVLTSGDCAKFDANGNIIDNGSGCSGGGGSGTVNSGTTNQIAYYASSGTAVSGTGNVTLISAAVFNNCNVLNNGATGNGSTDDTSAIQTLWNSASCPLIYAPAGTYKISTLTGPAVNGAGIIGDGMYRTIFSSTSAGSTVITGHVSLNGQRYENFQITRSVTATNGYGLDTGDPGNYTVVRNIYVTNQYNGIHLAGVAYGWAENIAAVSNVSVGVVLSSPSASSLQWQTKDIISQFNGSNGFTVIGSGQSAGNWQGLASFDNGGVGFAASGVAALRLQNSFFGSDHGDEVSITGGATNYTHNLTNVYTELSSTGYGFEFTGATAGVSCSNCSAVGNHLSGALVNQSGSNVTFAGGSFEDNGLGNVAGNTYGLYCIAGTMSAVGIIAPATGNQALGVVSTSGCTSSAVVASRAAVNQAASFTYAAGNF
jgi:hypothetical protein